MIVLFSQSYLGCVTPFLLNNLLISGCHLGPGSSLLYRGQGNL